MYTVVPKSKLGKKNADSHTGYASQTTGCLNPHFVKHLHNILFLLWNQYKSTKSITTSKNPSGNSGTYNITMAPPINQQTIKFKNKNSC